MATVLVADDEKSLRFAIRLILTRAGFNCLEAADGEEALRLVRQNRPDIVILDVMMPRLNGFKVCEEIRRYDESIGILILSAKSEIDDKKTGFHLGADDYLAKPFNDEELVLRVEALLRRKRISETVALNETVEQNLRPGTEVVRVGGLTIDGTSRTATFKEKSAPLTPREFDILSVLASEPGRVFTNEELISRIWGREYTDDAISIPVYIRRIRKKLEPDPSDPLLIKTIYRMGYRLDI